MPRRAARPPVGPFRGAWVAAALAALWNAQLEIVAGSDDQ
jgi:hypothetical protein